ncbi:MAG: tetratricopeptide repeat protein [Pseudomonadota bacterium]|nr:tetratricopeptide repeat protein [Pseudomonadota bacterium]
MQPYQHPSKRTRYVLDIDKLISLASEVQTTDPHRAIDYISKVIHVHPYYVEALHLRAGVLTNINQLHEACHDYDRLLTLNAQDVSAVIGSGEVKLRMSCWVDGLNLFKRALSMDPAEVNKHRALLGCARVYIYNQDYSNAFAMLNELLNDHPGHLHALILRGDLYRQRGLLDDALKDASRAMSIHPVEVASYNLRADIYKDKGDLESALADYSHVLQQNQSDYRVLCSRADTYRMLKRYDLALADIGLVKNQDVDIYLRSSICVHEALILVDIGKLDQALEMLAAMDSDVKDHRLWMIRAHIYELMDKKTEALKCYHKVLELVPDHNRAVVRVMTLLRESERYTESGLYGIQYEYFQEALDDFRMAIEIEPTNVLAHVHLGRLLLIGNNLSQAYEHAKVAVTYAEEEQRNQHEYANSHLADALSLRGECYLRFGCTNSRYDHPMQLDWSNGLVDLNHALSLNPRHPLAWASRGAIHNLKQDFTLAIQDFKQALVLNQCDVCTLGTLADILWKQSHRDEAEQHLTRALDLSPNHPELVMTKQSWFRGLFNGDLDSCEHLANVFDHLSIKECTRVYFASKSFFSQITGCPKANLRPNVVC